MLIEPSLVRVAPLGTVSLPPSCTTSVRLLGTVRLPSSATALRSHRQRYSSSLFSAAFSSSSVVTVTSSFGIGRSSYVPVQLQLSSLSLESVLPEAA